MGVFGFVASGGGSIGVLTRPVGSCVSCNGFTQAG